MDSFLLLRRLVAAIVFKGQTVSDYWWSRRTIFLTSCALRARQRDIPLESAKERWAGGTFESAVVVARVRLRLDS